MSDIFKKIRSIEAEDDAITDALGLKTTDNKVIASRPSPEKKAGPLKLTIPDDEDILDLDHLSLGERVNQEPVELPNPNDVPRPASRLGLTPIIPVSGPQSSKSSSNAPPPRPVNTNTATPLPDFMRGQSNDVPSPKQIKSKLEPVKPQPRIQNPTLDDNRTSPKRGLITIMGLFMAFTWMACAGILIFDSIGGSSAWSSISAIQKLGFSFMALFPLILIWLLTYAFHFISSLSRSSNALKATAEALMTPDDTVITRSTIMAKSIQTQVDEVNLKVSSALTRMELLDDMVKSQGSSLAKSALAINSTTSDVEHRISTQREGLESIASLFENRMSALSDMMESHSSQLASSGQMAEQRVQEARMSVEGAAERIASASETVRQNAVVAAQTLSGSQVEIAKLGDDVQAQSTRLDAVYRKHLNDLKIMLTDLREQQDELGATMEERLSKMRDMSLSAKVGAQSLTEASVKGRETVEALNEAASLTDTAVRARFSEMEEMVKYSTARAESISETAARQVQNSLSMTRKEIARIEADMMDLMDKLSRAETAKAAYLPANTDAIPPLRGSQFRQEDIVKLPAKAESELGSMEYGDIKNDPIESNPNNKTETSLFSLRRSIEDKAPPHPHDDTSLDIHTPQTQDLTNVLRRPVSSESTKDRSKWSLRGLFGGGDTENMPSPRTVTDGDIIERLTALGLTPAAIVDDGCIIEASNLRKVKGAAAMSEAVAKRLSEPVRHLFMAIETDAALKSDVRAFTGQFDARLSPLENDREAIRTRLESDAGRAYLLCDAALHA